MAKQAYIKFHDDDLENGLLDSVGIIELFGYLPNGTKLVSTHQDYHSHQTWFYFMSDSFIDSAPTVSMPQIVVNLKTIPGTPGKVYIDSLDMSAALAAYQPQGAPTTCTRQGCVPGSPCFMCAVNANAVTVGVSPGSSLPTHATPSPWGQVAGGSISYSGPPPTMFYGNIPKRTGYSTVPTVCAHDWKIYDSGWRVETYCTKCPEKKT